MARWIRKETEDSFIFKHAYIEVSHYSFDKLKWESMEKIPNHDK